MKTENRKKLIKELMEMEPQDEKVGELLSLAEGLSLFSNTERSLKFKKSFVEKMDGKLNKNVYRRQLLPHIVFTPIIAVLLLFIGSISISSAQESIPGDLLYPVKRISEKLIVAVKPEFKNEILERRSVEIKKLIEEDKDPKLLEETMGDYRKNINGNKNLSVTKIQESRNHLEKAKENNEKYRGDLQNLINEVDDKLNEKQEESREESKEIKGAEHKNINQNVSEKENIENGEKFE